MYNAYVYMYGWMVYTYMSLKLKTGSGRSDTKQVAVILI